MQIYLSITRNTNNNTIHQLQKLRYTQATYIKLHIYKLLHVISLLQTSKFLIIGLDEVK